MLFPMNCILRLVKGDLNCCVTNNLEFVFCIREVCSDSKRIVTDNIDLGQRRIFD